MIGVGVGYGAASHGAVSHDHANHLWDSPVPILLVVIGTGALVLRRRHPVAVLYLTFAAALTYAVAGYGSGPLFPALVVALVGAVAAGHRFAGALCLAAGYAGFLWLVPAAGQDSWPGLGAILGLAAWLLLLFAAGEALRIRRLRATERARMQEAETRRAVSEERLAIARELHDVLAHHISLINVQAGTALHRAQRSEELAYEALATIHRVSRDTLTEVRALLGTLRDVDEAAPRGPAPSIDRLPELVASAEAAGVTARVATSGTRRDLPASVDLAVYRIVQEALTNVARHAGTDRAEVFLEYGADDLVVQVDDDGAARAPISAGTGITGMTERATALGGRLQAGPRPDGGWRVRAWLPVDTSS